MPRQSKHPLKKRVANKPKKKAAAPPAPVIGGYTMWGRGMAEPEKAKESDADTDAEADNKKEPPRIPLPDMSVSKPISYHASGPASPAAITHYLESNAHFPKVLCGLILAYTRQFAFVLGGYFVPDSTRGVRGWWTANRISVPVPYAEKLVCGENEWKPIAPVPPVQRGDKPRPTEPAEVAFVYIPNLTPVAATDDSGATGREQPYECLFGVSLVSLAVAAPSALPPPLDYSDASVFHPQIVEYRLKNDEWVARESGALRQCQLSRAAAAKPIAAASAPSAAAAAPPPPTDDEKWLLESGYTRSGKLIVATAGEPSTIDALVLVYDHARQRIVAFTSGARNMAYSAMAYALAPPSTPHARLVDWVPLVRTETEPHLSGNSVTCVDATGQKVWVSRYQKDELGDRYERVPGFGIRLKCFDLTTDSWSSRDAHPNSEVSTSVVASVYAMGVSRRKVWIVARHAEHKALQKVVLLCYCLKTERYKSVRLIAMNHFKPDWHPKLWDAGNDFDGPAFWMRSGEGTDHALYRWNVKAHTVVRYPPHLHHRTRFDFAYSS